MERSPRSVAQFSSDEAALNEVVGGFAISDMAANVYSNLAALTADASHIASITATGGTVTVGNGLFVADEAALNLIVGGFAISGQASVLSGNLNNLEADSQPYQLDPWVEWNDHSDCCRVLARPDRAEQGQRRL